MNAVTSASAMYHGGLTELHILRVNAYPIAPLDCLRAGEVSQEVKTARSYDEIQLTYGFYGF